MDFNIRQSLAFIIPACNFLTGFSPEKKSYNLFSPVGMAMPLPGNVAFLQPSISHNFLIRKAMKRLLLY
jgi:hypothetical protein